MDKLNEGDNDNERNLSIHRLNYGWNFTLIATEMMLQIVRIKKFLYALSLDGL